MIFTKDPFTLALMKLRPAADWQAPPDGDVESRLALIEWRADVEPPSLSELQATMLQIQTEQDVPSTVRSGQLILALDMLGKLAPVDAAVAAIGGISQRLWDRASVFDRDNKMLIYAASQAGMTSADVDAVFRLADTL